MSDLERIDWGDVTLPASAPTVALDSEGTDIGGISPVGLIPPREECRPPGQWYQGPEQLRALDRDDDFARDLAALLGLELKAHSFRCAIPGHNGGAAAFWCDQRDYWIYRCLHPQARGSFALGQFYASVTARREIAPTGPSLARWKLRAAIDLGRAPLPSSRLRPLPAGAPASVEAVHRLIDHLCRVRALGEPNVPSPTPLSARFLLDWSRNDRALSIGSIGRATWWLAENGILRHVGTRPGAYRKPMNYWLPERRGD